MADLELSVLLMVVLFRIDTSQSVTMPTLASKVPSDG